MKITKNYIQWLVWILIVMLMIPLEIMAQDSMEPEEVQKFSKEELTQLLAGIALYPDSLIAQILMASTYPLEIVEAERWLRKNKDLKGSALNEALKEKPWDPSVKSLCHFPDVLFAMSDKLEQTRKLGDAFLSQEEDVMATIQELRHRAAEQGNLKTTKEQEVVVEQEIIMIEPANPQVVYVPVYDPLYIYGPWWYPAYPPFYWYFPPAFVVIGGNIVFGPSFFFGFGLFSWAWFDWHSHIIIIDVDKTTRFHRHRIKKDFDKIIWKHEPRHRRGVAYRDKRTSDRFGQKPLRVPKVSPETRGFPPTGMERRAVEPLRRPPERREPAVVPGVRPERERIERAPMRDTPFRGIGEGKFERRASERGRESRGTEIRRPGVERRSGGEIRSPGREMRGTGGGMRQPDAGSRGGTRGGGTRR